jgi:DNA-directed RNA polymerase subunit RPC12/RpoP
MTNDGTRERSTDPLVNVGLTRTDMGCHSCSKDFIAVIDYDLEGEHQIECPHCGHIHYRKIEAGKVTESRYNSDHRPRSVTDSDRRNLWKAKTEPIATVTEAQWFMRQLWLRKGYN